MDEYVTVRARVMSWRPAVNPHAARFAELESALLATFQACRDGAEGCLKMELATAEEIAILKALRVLERARLVREAAEDLIARLRN